MKAWYVFQDNFDGPRGYVLHFPSRNKAKYYASKSYPFEDGDWNSIGARRCPELDHKPITIQSMIEAGFNMTYEGEPIDALDLPCPCVLCKLKSSS